MDVSVLNLFMLVLFAGAGVYGVYTIIKLNRLGQLFDNKLLYPGNCSRKDCLDEQGYIAFIRPKLLVFSVVCLLAALCEVVETYIYTDLPMVAHIVIMVLELGAFVWLMLAYNRAARDFWAQ